MLEKAHLPPPTIWASRIAAGARMARRVLVVARWVMVYSLIRLETVGDLVWGVSRRWGNAAVTARLAAHRRLAEADPSLVLRHQA